MDSGPTQPTITRAILTDPVRALIHSEPVEPIEIIDWEQQALRYSGNPTTAGIYRITGHARGQAGIIPWSLVLKVIHASADGSEPASPGYWKREPLVYQSGLLRDLPIGVAAPQYLGVIELAADVIWLWLEDVSDIGDGRWPLSTYGLAARRLGRFNGAYLVRQACPSFPWLRADYLRAWVALGEAGVTQLPDVLDRPLVRQLFPPSVAARLIQLRAERERLLAVLADLPQTFCHMDAMRRNLVMRRDARGETQTLLIDWGEAGVGALGEDLAVFVTGSVFLEAETPPITELQDIAVAHYIDGLRDVGWPGDPRLVQRGYAIAAALRVLGASTWLLQAALHDDQHVPIEHAFGRPIRELLEHWATAIALILDGVDVF